MPVFEKRSRMPVPADEVYAWHLRPGSFARMTPPWNRIRVLERTGAGFEDGARLAFEVKLGPVWRRWIAEHHGNLPGRQFADRQVEGPFKSWDHTHRFVPAEQPVSELIDHIEFELPAGWLAGAAGTARRDGRWSACSAFVMRGWRPISSATRSGMPSRASRSRSAAPAASSVRTWPTISRLAGTA